jgi:hydrogenase maturation protease
LPAGRHFIHREHHPSDPAFLREERRFLDREWASLRVMERQREHLVHDIEEARSSARRVGIAADPPSQEKERALIALIGIGSRSRRDDAAGLEVARRLREARPPGVEILEDEGEPSSLLDAWLGADDVVVVDGVTSGSPPGTLHRYEATEEPLPAEMFRPSTHAMGIADAVKLGRELGLLPRRLAVYGLEGESFEEGEGLTESVELAVDQLVAELAGELG